MEDKEDELLSVQYKIEKSGIKQQNMENRLVSISDELRKSRRNSLIFIIVFIIIIGIITVAMYVLSENNNIISDVQEIPTEEDMIQMQKTNDSLREELEKLKFEIEDYRKNLDIERNGMDKPSDSSNAIVDPVAQTVVGDTVNKSKYQRQHAYVKKVFRSNGVIFIEADFIEYFKGKKAVEIAKKNNKAEFDIDDKGDTLYFLYNEYYVSNENSKIRRLELNDKANISGVNQISNGFPLKAFQKIIADNPIMILEIRDGIIYKITKEKLP